MATHKTIAYLVADQRQLSMFLLPQLGYHSFLFVFWCNLQHVRLQRLVLDLLRFDRLAVLLADLVFFLLFGVWERFNINNNNEQKWMM